jgi:hypothetical protein
MTVHLVRIREKEFEQIRHPRLQLPAGLATLQDAGIGLEDKPAERQFSECHVNSLREALTPHSS